MHPSLLCNASCSQAEQQKCKHHVTTDSSLNKFQPVYFELPPAGGVVEPYVFLTLHSELCSRSLPVPQSLCWKLDSTVALEFCRKVLILELFESVNVCVFSNPHSYWRHSHSFPGFPNFCVYPTPTPYFFLPQEMVICGRLLCDGCVTYAPGMNRRGMRSLCGHLTGRLQRVWPAALHWLSG